MVAAVGPLVRGQIPRLMLEGIYAVGMSYLFAEKSQYKKVFTVKNSQKATEFMLDTQDIGGMGQIEEAFNAPTSSFGQGVTYEWTHRMFAIQTSISMLAQDDNRYGKDFGLKASMFFNSDAHTREEVAMGLFNGAYETKWGDGVPLCSPVHPVAGGGYNSNTLAVQTGMSGTSIEAMSNLALVFRAQSGLNNTVGGRALLVPRKMRFDAHRIVKSQKRAGTSNNDTNVFIDLDILTEETLVSVFLQNQERFFMLTDRKDCLIWFDRKPMDINSWMDNNSRTTLMNGFTRNSNGPFGPYGVVGSGTIGMVG